jgi:hypothetical protein
MWKAREYLQDFGIAKDFWKLTRSYKVKGGKGELNILVKIFCLLKFISQIVVCKTHLPMDPYAEHIKTQREDNFKGVKNYEKASI